VNIVKSSSAYYNTRDACFACVASYERVVRGASVLERGRDHMESLVGRVHMVMDEVVVAE